MVWLRHKGCKTPIIEYVGLTPLCELIHMRSAEWRFTDGRHPGVCSEIAAFCPDCEKRFSPCARNMETCDGSPYRHGDRPKHAEKKLTPWERLKAFFSFQE